MKNNYSESLENYLEAICIKGGEHVKSIDLAKHLNVSRASVNRAINTLIDEGLVEKKPYGDISLTEAGKKVSQKVFWKHKLLRRFLIDFIGVAPDLANEEACGMEHTISDETAEKIEAFMASIEKSS